MLRAEEFVLDYPINPANVCGGVWVGAERRFVPVTPAAPYHDEATGTTLYEYNDAAGNGRACLLSVPAGHSSQAWEITDQASYAGYYEQHCTVAGAGTFDRWRPAFGDVPARYVGSALPDILNEPLHVSPGDTFRVRASHQLGVHVLAVFPGAAFKPKYEKRVTPLAIPLP